MEQCWRIFVFAVDDDPLEVIERAVNRFQDCHEIDQAEAGPKQKNLDARTRVDGDCVVKLIHAAPDERRRGDLATPLADDPSVHVAGSDPAGIAPGKIIVILNAQGGTVARMGHAAARFEIIEAFADHGIAAETVLVRGKTIVRTVRKLAASYDAQLAAATAPPVIIAAGGDGTVNAVVQALASTGAPLGILPLGTLNHFARDLGLPFDIPGAVAVIAAGNTTAVDVAEVNNRIFVNNSSIGLYPDMVRDRERQRRQTRRAKWLAMALAFVRTLRRPPMRRLTIEAENWVRPLRTPLAFIGNNVYETKFPTLGRRATLTGGVLCLLIAKAERPFDIIRLLLRAAFGRLDQARDFEQHHLQALAIRSRHRRLLVALDGEVAILTTPLAYRIRPRDLRVFVPRPSP
jgi:diacylglycerol kinase family enzyme